MILMEKRLYREREEEEEVTARMTTVQTEMVVRKTICS